MTKQYYIYNHTVIINCIIMAQDMAKCSNKCNTTTRTPLNILMWIQCLKHVPTIHCFPTIFTKCRSPSYYYWLQSTLSTSEGRGGNDLDLPDEEEKPRQKWHSDSGYSATDDWRESVLRYKQHFIVTPKAISTHCCIYVCVIIGLVRYIFLPCINTV